MHCLFYRKILIIFLIGLFATGDDVIGNDVIVKAQSDQGVVIEFSPQQWMIQPEIVNGKSYYKIYFENCVFRTSTGQPLIPRRTIVVGIPFGAQVPVELLESEKKETIEGKLLPTPGFERHSIAAITYREDQAIYQAGQLFPRQLVEISSPAIIRDQQVVVVSFYPVQYFPPGEQIQLYDRIKARLDFVGGLREKHSETRLNNDPSNNQLIINHDQAEKWRKTRMSKKPAKFSKTFLEQYYKIWLGEEGIYKISGADLQQAGIELNNIKPYQIQLFNNGGFQLPPAIHENRPDSLIENTIFVSDGGDGSFDSRDYILFYGKSVNGWKYDRKQQRFAHYLHPYTKQNVYWLCWQHPDSGKRMSHETVTAATSVTEINSFYDLHYVENEYKNLLNSGTTWLGNYFNAVNPERSYIFDLPGVSQNVATMVKVNLAGISGGEQKFSLYFNDAYIAEIPAFYSSGGEYKNIKMKEFAAIFQAGLQDGYNRLKVKYSPGSDVSYAYMDWIELSVHRQLQAKEDQLLFYSPDSIGFYKYQLHSFTTDEIEVYDVTNFYDVFRLKLNAVGSGAVEFIDSTNSDVPKRYIAVTPNSYQSPIKIEQDMASNWRNCQNSADFIIISYDNFYDAALALKSLRENSDTLNTTVVKISDVYDEFSGGLVDPTAIRDFIKYAYDNWQNQPRYVLLFGDGDYDYNNVISPHDPNWIPPYETPELAELASRARDDWYVCVVGDDNLLDLAIGRIPVRNPDEAMAVVKKIIAYENSPVIGEWCNTITMVADDEYGQGGKYDAIDHIPDTDGIAQNLIPKNYNTCKIYLTEYPAVHDASISGIRKPAAHQALMKQIDQGSLIINFIGHGNEQVWTHERILAVNEDLPQLNNGQRQAFWIASTCNFARFDNPNFQGFAEQLVTTPDNGAIAVFSSCRLAEPFANVSLNQALFRFLFNESTRPNRLGDAIMLAKNSTGNWKNDQLYHLLGDPTLRLAMPKCWVQVTNYWPDSMKALSRMQVEGKVQFRGDPAPAFNGQLLFKALDSQRQRSYIVNQWKSYEYTLPGNTIFRGEVSVTDGEFQTKFIIPKDITYGGSEGRFSAFYWQDDMFGAGNLDGISVGGTLADFDDYEGPNIVIGFEGQDFMPGSFVPPNPVLKITISDSASGVNIAGDIGHKITMILDHAEHEKVELNDYFQYHRDSYQVGTVSYPLTNLAEGIHYIQVKAWDNCNNSSQSEAEFSRVSQDKLIIRDVFNYPNPFSNSTEFTFWASQNCDVEIKIYSISGRLIGKTGNFASQTGFNRFYWNGCDQDGEPMANGVYLYKVCASCYNGEHKIRTEQIEKCVIMR